MIPRACSNSRRAPGRRELRREADRKSETWSPRAGRLRPFPLSRTLALHPLHVVGFLQVFVDPVTPAVPTSTPAHILNVIGCGNSSRRGAAGVGRRVLSHSCAAYSSIERDWRDRRVRCRTSEGARAYIKLCFTGLVEVLVGAGLPAGLGLPVVVALQVARPAWGGSVRARLG